MRIQTFVHISKFHQRVIHFLRCKTRIMSECERMAARLIKEIPKLIHRGWFAMIEGFHFRVISLSNPDHQFLVVANQKICGAHGCIIA